MKKLISFILAAIMLISVLPISAGAENTAEIEVPKSVQYKLLNHDKVKLRWSKVENADCYYIYSYNYEKGKYRKEGEASSTSCTLTDLTANTEYTIAVVSVKKSKKLEAVSKKCKTTFTTPDEWYYSLDDGDGLWGYFKLDDEVQCMREHYDGTGVEEFDFSPLKEKLKDYYENEYKNKEEDEDEAEDVASSIFIDEHFEQRNGFVYVTAGKWWPEVDDMWRMNNDGSNLDFFGISSGELIQISSNYVYCMLNADAGLHGGYVTPDVCWCGSSIICSQINAPEIIDKEYATFSNIVYDGKYIYFAEEPINYNADDKNAYIYRAKPTGSQLKTIYKKPYNPGANPEIIYDVDREDETKCYSRFIEMIGCDENNLYFYCCEMVHNEPIFNFYRMSTQKENSVPQKIFSHNFYQIQEIEYSNGHFYFTVYEKLGEYWGDIYYCMKSDGTGLTKQDKPFEWKY